MGEGLAHAQPRKLRAMTSAIVLTLVAGYVDAIGFLRFGGIYVANMSGNSIAVGIHAALGPVATVLRRLLPVGAFVFAALCTRLAINVSERSSFRRIVGLCLLAEATCLAIFIVSENFVPGIALGAVAMGIQAAAIVRFSGVTLYTAFVTGSLIKFSENAAELLVGSAEQGRSRRTCIEDAIWFGGVWLAYVGGAVAGASAFHVSGPAVTGWACVVLAVFALLDLIDPTILS